MTVSFRLGAGNGPKLGERANAIQRHLMRLGRNVRGVRFGVVLPHERRGLGRKRLRGPGLFAAQVRLRHRPFLDRPERFTGDAIEHKEQPVLRALRHGVDLFAAVIHRQQHRRTRQILVQQIVMHDLEMPEPFPGRGVQRHDAVGEQIHPMPLAAVEIGLGRLGRDVNDAALFIERLAAPRHHAGGGFVGLRRPGVVAHFAGTGNQVKDPAPLPGPHIEGAHAPGSADAAEDQQSPCR